MENCKSPLDCPKNAALCKTPFDRVNIFSMAIYDSNYDRDYILELFTANLKQYLNDVLVQEKDMFGNKVSFDVQVKNLELCLKDKDVTPQS